MKITAISDIHGNLNGLNFSNSDIAVIAGDFSKMTGFGKWHLYDQVKWIRKNFIPLIKSFPNTQFCVIPGNHDLVFDETKISEYKDIDFTIEWPENANLLIDKEVEINGIRVYGSPWIPIISHRWAFETEGDELSRKFKSIPENLDILITHTPPHIGNSINIDRSMQYGGYEAFGSGELANSIFEKNPKHVFCGHIHSGDHSLVEFGNSKIYNVSRLDERYEIAYDPLEIEI